MAIGNFGELAAAVAGWLARDDLAGRIPSFIALAEAAFNREFRVRAMEQRATTATVAGQQYYAWPGDLLEVRYIRLLGDPPAVLTYLSPAQFAAREAEAGRPRFWSDIQAALALSPVPASGATVEIDYFRRLDLEAAGTDGNWLIGRHPDIYLYGTLMQAEPYLMNDPRAQTWAQLLNAAVEQMNREDWRIKAGVDPRRVAADYQGA
jgi:hypothetical protein